MIAFDIAQLACSIEQFESQMAEPGFWDDRSRARDVAKQLEANKTQLQNYQEFERHLEDLEVLIELSAEEGEPLPMEEIESQAAELSQELDKLELQTFLSEPLDNESCYFSINSGAGGTDAQDWAEMLLRMYANWLQNSGYRYTILEVSAGEVAGIKSALLEVHGPYAYGYLKAEQGVHRMVRISPYDSNGRRHTSFASAAAIPIIEDADIEIDPEDLRIDTYRAGGAGGQHVNKTDSAVRITHIPTGIVAACQKERSQHQNKDVAMKVLKARLYEKQRQEKEEELASMRGEQKKIEWGSQIRSYVFHPYQMVKDHRTEKEIGNVQAVMDGDLDELIEAFLRFTPSKS